MDKKKKVGLMIGLFSIAAAILVAVGATFAYFSATVASNNSAISASSAFFELKFEDDTSLLKNNLIPSEEQYVDMALARIDDDGNFIAPPDGAVTGTEETRDTVCVDDNLNEICSLYTFTVINEMTDYDVPLYITLDPVTNTFENLYVKILDEEKNEIDNSKIHLLDSRYEVDEDDNYQKDESGALVPKTDFETLKMESFVLSSINDTLEKATKDDNTKEVTPSKVTYTLVIWINETHKDQTSQDSGKSFAGGITVKASSADGYGIRGIISAAGVE